MFIINFGVGIDANRNEANYGTVADVLNDGTLQAELGFSSANVDARVNGVIVDPGTRVANGMRIELLKKAGRKSDALTKDNQLSPIGMNYAVETAVDARANEAINPLYVALEAATAASRKAIALKQREVLKECKPFADFVDSLIESVVDNGYLDAVGALKLPVKVRDELDGVVKDANEALKPQRDAIEVAEAAVAAWKRNVKADLAMAVTVESQRVILSRVLASDPTEAWVISATPEG